MAGNQLPFAEGASINRPPLFCGDNYAFWKVRMKIFMESIHRSIWQAVVTEYKVPTILEDGNEIEKPFESWDQNEIRRAENDAKALNIIHSALNSDEFFRISTCTTAKEAWDLIQVTHEGTPEVRRAKKNTLIQEYETFRMTQGESIMDMQKRFTHIMNHLKGLGKTFVEEEVNVKVLKSLNRKWQPTVTAITESKNLAKMTSAELFGKLREYEMDMTRMADEEQKDKRAKGLALKTEDTTSESDTSCCDSESDKEDMNLMVRKFKKFMRKRNDKKRFSQQKKYNKRNDSSSSKVTCYECGKVGHYKSDCPNLKKQNSFEPRRHEHEEKSKKDRFKKKKAYIAWEENDTSTSSESDEEEANLCLMIKQESDQEVSDSDSSNYDYDELHDAFCKLYKEAKRVSKLNIVLNRNISDLENSVNYLKSENERLKVENEALRQPCMKCTDISSVLKNNHHRLYDSNQMNMNASFTCSYCMKPGHNAYNCMIKRKGVPYGAYKWVKKTIIVNGANMTGPKRSWVPKLK